MNPNDTENIKLINHHRKTPTTAANKKEQDKNEIANQITSNYQAGQGKHSGHSLHCVNRNLAASNLSSTYPVPNNQIQTANYLNQKDQVQQLAQQPPPQQQQTNHRPPFYQHHHHTHHQPHVHHYHPNTPESVYSQSLHYLHPHQFYYLHNQPKFFTGSPHQCQFTASVQPTPPQLSHSHSGTTNLNSLPPATACANLINPDSSVNTTTSFQSNQISPTQQQQQLQSIEPITNPNYINSTQARSSSITNYSPQQPSNHYPGVNAAATAYSNRNQFHHKQSASAAGKQENKMNQQDYNVDWNKKIKKWQRFPGRNKFYCDGRLMIAKQAGVFYFTLSLLVAVCTAFFIIDCPYLALHVSKFIPAVGAILFVFALSTLLRTSFSDPGGRLRQSAINLAFESFFAKFCC